MKLVYLILPLITLASCKFDSRGFNLLPRLHRQSIRASLSGHHKEPSPHPRLITYVQTLLTPNEKKHVSLLPLLWHETRVTHAILSTIHLHPKPGKIYLNDHPFDDDEISRTWQEVKALQNHGVKVMGMLGGAAGGTFKHLNGSEEAFYAYYNPLKDLLIKHGLDGLDLDIEEAVPLSTPLRLLNALHRDFGPTFILTLSPIASALLSPSNTDQNLSGFSYFDLDTFATIPGSDTKLISWFNVQFYGHFPRGPPLYQHVIEAGWEPERVVMGVLDSPEGGPPNGFLRMEMLRKRIRELMGRWEGFGGVAGWEYWDGGTGDGVIDRPWEWLDDVANELFGRVGHGRKDEL